MKSTLTPSPKKLSLLAALSLFLAGLCFSVEVIFNKITAGTQLISLYESLFFLGVASYFALQLIPGFAKITLSEQGFREIWFFRQRIQVKWMDIDMNKSLANQAGDSLYLNHENEQLFSRKVAIKGIYTPSIQEIYHHFIACSKTAPSSQPSYYFSLKPVRRLLLSTFVGVFMVFNGVYLSSDFWGENNNAEIKEQLKEWQQQHKTPEQIFDALKKYGLTWKKALKQFDRRLYFQVLEVESTQIEKLMLKYFQENHQPSEKVLEYFKQDIASCRKRFLFQNEVSYLQCLNQL